MTDPSKAAAQTDDLPEVAVEETKRRISIIWLIPIIAILAGGWLAYTTIAEKGPTITISFKDGSGLEAGKTKVKFNDVEVGLVDSVEIDKDDISRVTVMATMKKGVKPYLTENTKFWVVRPRIGLTGVSGLGALFAGDHIAVDPSTTGKPTKQFTGLEQPPLVSSYTPGQKVTLRAQTLGSLSRGAPVYFRKLKVGEVTGFELSEDMQSVTIDLFVNEPHHLLVRENTKFWNVSGIEVSASAGGVDVHMESLAALLAGGIAFETPEPAGKPVEDGVMFTLHKDYAGLSQPVFTEKITYVMYFDESVRGLEEGASVDFRGMKVGSVRDIKARFDKRTGTVKIPVLIDMEVGRVPYAGSETKFTIEQTKQNIDTLVKHGMRAQLKTGSLLTGKMFIGLDLHPDSPAKYHQAHSKYPELPTIPGTLEAIEDAATHLLTKLEKLPLEQIAQNLLSATQGLDRLMNDPELGKTVHSANAALTSLNKVARDVDRKLIPKAEKTLSAFDENSPAYVDMADTLEELAAAARSMRVFTDYIEQHPDALIKGKR